MALFYGGFGACSVAVSDGFGACSVALSDGFGACSVVPSDGGVVWFWSMLSPW